MGKPCLDWSPIQLRLANQVKVLPIGRLSNIIIDVEGLRTYADFEVINIVDDKNPYPTLLGIDWAINNQTIINFKKRIILLRTHVNPPLYFVSIFYWTHMLCKLSH